MDEHLLRFKEDTEYVFIDLETENLCLNREQNLPWQIGMIKVKGDKAVATKDFHIKWDTHLKISADAARITKFNPKVLEKKGLPQKKFFLR